MCCEKLRETLDAPETCFDHRLSCSENGRKFAIQLPPKSKETFCRAKTDDCLISKESPLERCDFIFQRCENGDLYFVELKGKDVEKAFSQIKSTIEHYRPKLRFQPEHVTGFIIVSRCPVSSARLQILRNEFIKKKYGHTLEVHSREWTHKIEQT